MAWITHNLLSGGGYQRSHFVFLALVMLTIPSVRADKAGDLLQAAAVGDLAKVQGLLASGTSANTTDKRGCTPLMGAAQYGHDDIVHLLLKSGAELDRVDKSGNSALHYAATGGFAEPVQTLLDAGVPVDLPGAFRTTPLILGAKSVTVVRVLLGQGANPNAGDSQANTPLMTAAQAAGSESIRLLLEHGANINAKNLKGENALFFAARAGSRENVRVLAERGADIKVVSVVGESVQAAAKSEHRTATAELLNDLESYGVEEYRKMVDSGMIPYLKVGDLEIWRRTPSRLTVELGTVRVDPTERRQVPSPGPDWTAEMNDDQLLDSAERLLIPGVQRLGAKAILVTRATIESHSFTKRTPGLGTEIAIGVLAGLAGRTPPVVIPGLDVFIDLTYHLEAKALRYADSLPAAVSAANSGDFSAAADITFWDSVKNSTDPKLLELYLAKFPSGRFASAAHNRLAAIDERREKEKLEAGRPGVVFFVCLTSFKRNNVTVSIDGTKLAKLPAKTFLQLELPAGQYTVRTDAPRSALARHKPLLLSVAPGKHHFVVAEIGSEGFPNPVAVDGDTGWKYVRMATAVDRSLILDKTYLAKE